MNEAKFWAIVAEINWAERCKAKRIDTDLIKLKIAKKYPQAEMKQFDKIHTQKYNMVYKIIEEQEVRIGDDSCSDLCNHVVGMGEVYFNDIIANPDKISNVLYRESFGYCLPYNEDYERLQAGYYVEKADKFTEKFIMPLKTGLSSEVLVEEIGKIEDVIQVMKEGRFEDLPIQEVAMSYYETLKNKVMRCAGSFNELEDIIHLVKRSDWYFFNITESARNVGLALKVVAE